MSFKLGVIGIDHGHIFGMLDNMLKQGCTCDAYWTDGPAVTETKFRQVFPQLEKADDPVPTCFRVASIYAIEIYGQILGSVRHCTPHLHQSTVLVINAGSAICSRDQP